jgi:hypothetical protein
MALRPGQTLWYVPFDSRQHETEVEVISVGTKWVTLTGHMRMDKHTLHIDGGHYTSPGRCYLTYADWEDAREKKSTWLKLHTQLRAMWNVPEHITISDIQKIANMLRIDIS